MMRFERPVRRPFVCPVEIGQLFEHLRVPAELQGEAVRLAIASGWEIEDRAQIALLRQTVTATVWHPRPGAHYRLPVGPVPVGASVTASVLPPGGPETPLNSGQIVVRYGLRPILYLIDDGDLPPLTSCSQTLLTVQYEAGFGDKPADIPADLAQAVMDQAASAFDTRGTGQWRDHSGLSPHASRVVANYRGVTL